MPMRRSNLCVVILLGAAIAGCHSKPVPVGRLDVQPRTITLPGSEVASIHLTWTPTKPLDPDSASGLTSFVHLIDATGKVLRTFDQPFPQPWNEGTTIGQDIRIDQSAMAPPLAPGQYRLSVGLYHRNQRFALEGLGEPIGRSEYVGAEVQVPATSDAPRFVFSPDWQPVDAGSDRQVLARRWLAATPSTLRVEDIKGPGGLWMLLYIPPGNAAGEKLVLHSGGAVPSVLVRNSCGPTETTISGAGEHEVEMAIDAPGAGGSCEVTLSPSFHIESKSEPPVRSASLQSVAWNPKAPTGAGRPAGAP